ncbi:hypothetical protein BVX99_00735 [bacterium F16]|nr:hypothetical protein BVX99_00735 [bacterium F16]
MAGKAEKIALFIDFENLEKGVKKQFDGRVEIELLTNKLKAQGSLSVQRGYADWAEQSSHRQALLQAGVELIECTRVSPGSNGAEVKLAIDAVENALRPGSGEIFAIATGNSDYLPLIYKLKELGKTVIIFSVDAFTSDQVKAAADEYMSYSSLSGATPAPAKKPANNNNNNKPQRIPNELLKAIAKILTEKPNYRMEAAKLKLELQKKSPSFDEATYGSKTFPDLVEFIQKKKLLPIKVDKKGDTCSVQLIDEKAQKEKEEQWEDRPMTEKEWEAFMEAVEGCINEGAGRANQGKLWIINAYLHRKRVDGILPLTNNILFSSLQALTEYGALRRTENDCYLMNDDYQYKKEDFLDELFGVEIDEEFYDEDAQNADKAPAE